MAIEGISSNNQNNYEVKPILSNNKLPEIRQQFDTVFLQSAQKSKSIEQHFIIQDNLLKNHDKDEVQSVNNTTTSLASITAEDHHDLAIESPLESMSDTTEINQSKEGFVKCVWPYARKLANLVGLDPKVLLAQAALETGWGQFIAKDSDGSSSNNLFNIKAPKNSIDSVQIKTTEYLNDTPFKTKASFKKYESINESMIDYLALMQNNPRYQAAMANTNDSRRYIAELQKAGYATDPNYADKILQIYQGSELEQALNRNGFS